MSDNIIDDLCTCGDKPDHNVISCKKDIEALNLTDWKAYEKDYFQANMLDGDDVKDCGGAMLSAESVLEYVIERVECMRKMILDEELVEKQEGMYCCPWCDDAKRERLKRESESIKK